MESFNLGRAIRKFFLSAFVIITFAAYVLQQHLANQGQKISAAPRLERSSKVGQVADLPRATPAPTQNDLAVPTPTGLEILPSPTPTGLYRDGTYTGPEVDAYYGLVQVQAIVQGGKILDVQFLEYPRDRRTSQRINSQAMPWLQQEAIQAQSANVDIISGATLTSEAFAQSLQAALQAARNGS
jgi:uncharacterized protein with FMN-binding domain